MPRPAPMSAPEAPPAPPTHAGRYVLDGGTYNRTDEDAAPPEAGITSEPSPVPLALPPAAASASPTSAPASEA
jgi:hypothetical protein